MSDARDATEWVRVMVDRYRLPADLDIMIADAQFLTAEERASVQYLCERLWFEAHLSYSDHPTADSASSAGAGGEFRTPRLADLADAWAADSTGHEHPDWTRLRSFLDYLARHPGLATPAIEEAPPASGSLLLDNLLAGIAEKEADDAGSPRPAWTSEVARLEEPWTGLGTPRMLAANARATPPQLAARLIFIPADALWRRQS